MINDFDVSMLGDHVMIAKTEVFPKGESQTRWAVKGVSLKVAAEYTASLVGHINNVRRAGVLTGVDEDQLSAHDLSKWGEFEFAAYANWFFGEKSPENKLAYDYAWLHHQNHNPHHWQYWIIKYDDEGGEALPMPESYIREMVADWLGAGRAYTGRWDMVLWLNANGPKMILHEETHNILHGILMDLGYQCTDNCDWSYLLMNGTLREWDRESVKGTENEY